MDDTRILVTSWAAARAQLQAVRREVFIVEQAVPEEEEWDEDDPGAVHVLATLNREPVGTGRLTPAGKIGRLAVLSEFRGRGIGTRMLEILLQEASRRGMRELFLHAQVQAVAMYEKFGFTRQGQVFVEAGIPHLRMTRSHGDGQMQDDVHENQPGRRRVLATLEDVRDASLEVAGAATRLLAMYTQDLEPLVYDQPKFIDAVKKLVLASGYAKVRVLLADPAKAVYESSRFVGLARRITSYIEIRHAHPDFRADRAAYLIADDRSIVYRSDASRWDGVLELNGPAVARRYLDLFDAAWMGSEPHPETRQLHL